MSLPQNVADEQLQPFSYYLEQAVRNSGQVSAVQPSPRDSLRSAAAGHLRAGWRWLQRARAAQSAGRRLRVTETMSLGEKRFISIIQVDHAQFLIGSSATGVQLLAQMEPSPGVGALTPNDLRESA